MAIYKNKDIQANINERGVELGNINVNFYTEDNGTASKIGRASCRERV